MTRLHLPLGILWSTIQEHLWLKGRSVMTRLAWYLHELWWHIWKSILSLWENDWFLATSRGSCHPCPYTFMNWPKMLQNGKSVYSLWNLIPSVSYPFPRNVMWQRDMCNTIPKSWKLMIVSQVALYCSFADGIPGHFLFKQDAGCHISTHHIRLII